RSSRIKLACSRCQKRKIKCDGQVPACSSCKKTGAICSGGNTSRDRLYVNSLWNRVRWLESALEGLSPDFDFSQAPPVGSGQPEESQTQNGGTVNLDPITPNRHGGDTTINTGDLTTVSNGNQVSTPAGDADQSNAERVHDIGLVSVGAGHDLRYVGPSSGYAFAKLLLKVTGVPAPRGNSLQQKRRDLAPSDALTAAQALRITPSPLPAKLEHSVQLSSVYWETMHPQYPFLHQPTYLKRLEHVYGSPEPRPVYKFQTFMVLAISATVLSHRYKTVLSAEGFAASALEAFEKTQVEGSLEGIQCLLLLIVYALVNPSTRLNAWYLNYLCISAVLDLGLQRDVRGNLSLLTREMRTRIFWVVYSLDRSLATALGRPIGLRDEACDLRLPLDIDDDQLLDPNATPRQFGTNPMGITNAIHLIKLAHLNSEIKYIGHSISNKTPSYCYPVVTDLEAWQSNMQSRLDQWAVELSQHCPSRYLTQVATLRYHEARILLLRPSPANISPAAAALRTCHVSASAVVRITLEMYREDLLVYSWPAMHTLFLATITMLYCVCAVPDLSEEAATAVEAVQMQLQAVSNILSSAAETWPDARRSRDVLDEVGTATIRWIRRT
ncbi:fungal-specific transcription factor domain-containing protein, partial [Pseudomassariella vexata]